MSEMFGRMVGHEASLAGSYTRVVDRFTLYKEPLSFRSLCARVLRPSTSYLLLDLDRTTHRGVNLGELFAWEIASYKFFGPELCARPDIPRVRGRLLHDPERPLSLPVYILDGARRWAYPGLSYLLWGKLAAHSELVERWSYRKFGKEPMRAVQRVPQTALLHDIATLPKDTLRMLAQRVWDVASPMQVIERADLAWVRARCPRIRIILTSASPQPMVEVAGEALGVDGIECSVTRDLGDRYASPYWVDRRFALDRIDHIAGPGQVRINSGHAKIERLIERYPNLLDKGVESVGVSDTGYGEDHAWAQYLSVVIDVNSNAPFPPLVAHDAPLREVHSAQLLTCDERLTTPKTLDAVQLRAEDYAPALAPIRQRVESLSAECVQIRERIAPARIHLQAELADQRAAIGSVVSRFNAASEGERPRLLSALRRQLRGEADILQELAELEQPLSFQFMAITNALRASRRELDAFARARPRLRLVSSMGVEPMLEVSLA